MDNIIYDTEFNLNEWFVIIMFFIGLIVIWKLPKTFTLSCSIFNFLFGIVTGLMFDHTIGVPPFDFYDVGDQSNYQTFDMFSYVMYAPFGYLFIFIYKQYNLRGFSTIFYIILWTAIGILVEWVAMKVGIFHYKNGYKIIYSVPIYVIVQSIHLFAYNWLFNKN